MNYDEPHECHDEHWLPYSVSNILYNSCCGNLFKVEKWSLTRSAFQFPVHFKGKLKLNEWFSSWGHQILKSKVHCILDFETVLCIHSSSNLKETFCPYLRSVVFQTMSLETCFTYGNIYIGIGTVHVRKWLQKQILT